MAQLCVRGPQISAAAAPGLPYPGQVGLGKGQVLLLTQGIPLQDVLVVEQQQLGGVFAGTSPAPLVPGSVRAPALPGGFQVLSCGGAQGQVVAKEQPLPTEKQLSESVMSSCLCCPASVGEMRFPRVRLAKILNWLFVSMASDRKNLWIQPQVHPSLSWNRILHTRAGQP